MFKFKNNILVQVLICGGVVLSANLSFAKEAAQETRLNNMQLKSCNNEKKCIEIKAQSATSSQFAPVYALEKYQIYIHSAGKTKELVGKNGYIDFDQDLVVVNKADGSEYSVNLKNLEERDYSK